MNLIAKAMVKAGFDPKNNLFDLSDKIQNPMIECLLIKDMSVYFGEIPADSLNKINSLCYLNKHLPASCSFYNSKSMRKGSECGRSCLIIKHRSLGFSGSSKVLFDELVNLVLLVFNIYIKFDEPILMDCLLQRFPVIPVSFIFTENKVCFSIQTIGDKPDSNLAKEFLKKYISYQHKKGNVSELYDYSLPMLLAGRFVFNFDGQTNLNGNLVINL